MAVSHLPVCVQNPNVGLSSFISTYTPNTKQTLITAGANGTKVVSIQATSTETANIRALQLWLTRSATSYLLNTSNIPVNSGFDGATAPNNALFLMAPPIMAIDNDGQRYLFLMSGDTLQISLTTAPATGKEVDVIAMAGDF
jgi:hypothetical protein